MKKLTFSLLLCIGSIASITVSGQFNNEIGLNIGGANYLGDIGGKEQTARRFLWDMKLDKTRPMSGLYFRHKFNNLFALNASANYGRIVGDDRDSENIARNTRNLRFRNNIKELNLSGELNILELADVGGRGAYQTSMNVFVHSGLSIFHHNPKGKIDGTSEWYLLQPLKTEGVEYSNWGIGIPAGLGVNFTYRRHHRFGWKMTWTKTFTDYLDDISGYYINEDEFDSNLAAAIANQSQLSDQSDDQAILNSFAPGEKRGDEQYNDAYLFSSVSYGYMIRTEPRNWPYPGPFGRKKAKSKGSSRLIRHVF